MSSARPLVSGFLRARKLRLKKPNEVTTEAGGGRERELTRGCNGTGMDVLEGIEGRREGGRGTGGKDGTGSMRVSRTRRMQRSVSRLAVIRQPETTQFT